MKSMIFVGLGLCMTLLLACKKDEGPSNCAKLEAKWQLESWKDDGVEQFSDSTYIITAQLEFKALVGVMGDYTLDINYLIGGLQNIFGAYVVNDGCDQVTLTPKDGIAQVFDFHFNGDELFMNGTINAVVTELKFKKE